MKTLPRNNTGRAEKSLSQEETFFDFTEIAQFLRETFVKNVIYFSLFSVISVLTEITEIFISFHRNMKTKKKRTTPGGGKIIIEPQMMNFVNKMGKYYESFGISRIGGQMVGLMLITEGGISQEDMQRILGVSRSSISTNLKMLLLNAGVEEVHVQGDRKSYFMVSDRAVEQSILRKINSYDYLTDVVNEGILGLKKKGSSVEKLFLKEDGKNNASAF